MPTVRESRYKKDLTDLQRKRNEVVIRFDEDGNEHIEASAAAITYWDEKLRRKGLAMGKSDLASGPGDPHDLLVYWGSASEASDMAIGQALLKLKKSLSYLPDYAKESRDMV